MKQLFLDGGPVMWPLLACSLISLFFCLERLLFWFSARRSEDADRVDEVIRLVGAGKRAAAAELSAGRPSYILQVLNEGLRVQGPHTSMFIALDHAAAHKDAQMRRFLSVLDTIITMSPMLGILGTVLGIIQAFHAVSGSLENVSVVAGGISQALITTAYGLIIAIGTLIPYNVFQSQAARAHDRLEAAMSQLELAVHEAEENRPAGQSHQHAHA